MNRSLLDTSTLSDIMLPSVRQIPAVAAAAQQYLRSHGRFTFSHISCFEILRGLRKRSSAKRIQQFSDFCSYSELVPVSYEVLDRAAEYWAIGKRRGITVEDSDLFIASTALLQRLPLVTANPKHFDWLPDLTILNWRDLNSSLRRG